MNIKWLAAACCQIRYSHVSCLINSFNIYICLFIQISLSRYIYDSWFIKLIPCTFIIRYWLIICHYLVFCWYNTWNAVSYTCFYTDIVIEIFSVFARFRLYTDIRWLTVHAELEAVTFNLCLKTGIISCLYWKHQINSVKLLCCRNGYPSFPALVKLNSLSWYNFPFPIKYSVFNTLNSW